MIDLAEHESSLFEEVSAVLELLQRVVIGVLLQMIA